MDNKLTIVATSDCMYFHDIDRRCGHKYTKGTFCPYSKMTDCFLSVPRLQHPKLSDFDKTEIKTEEVTL